VPAETTGGKKGIKRRKGGESTSPYAWGEGSEMTSSRPRRAPAGRSLPKDKTGQAKECRVGGRSEKGLGMGDSGEKQKGKTTERVSARERVGHRITKNG